MSKESLPVAEAPQAQIGPYRLGKRIGAGGMASVFEATHDQLGKRVALKVLHPHVGGDSRAVTRFLREGRAASRIRHPHAVSVIDAGVAGEGTPYLVMELEQGETLASLLRTFGALEPTQAVDLILPIVSAIQHAHSLGIVHRDIKPGNILVASDHVGDTVSKITDFGISRWIDASSDKRITADRGLLGTLPYMAPEQLLTPHEASVCSDQYSVGVVLYECLTGRLPFTEEGAIELMAAILNAPLVPPHSLRPDLPPELDAIVRRALERAPEQRFATMRALGEALLPFASERVAVVSSREFRSVGEASGTRLSRPPRVETNTEEDESRVPPARARRTRVWPGVAVAASLGVIGAFALSFGRAPAQSAAISTASAASPTLPAPPSSTSRADVPRELAFDVAPPSAVPGASQASPPKSTPNAKKDGAKRSPARSSAAPTPPSSPKPAEPSAEDNGAPILD